MIKTKDGMYQLTWEELRPLLTDSERFNERRMHMIKKGIKCPRCKKNLLLLYGTAVRSVTCVCGCNINLKQKSEWKEKRHNA